MSRERAQALVEAALALPVCVCCAVALVDCGVLVRDRIATTQAASRAAEARLAGDDVEAAAIEALPRSLRESAIVTDRDERIEVRTTSAGVLARFAGRPVAHRSSVEVPR